MSGPHFWIYFLLEKLDLHIIYIHGIDSINWELTSTITAVCATVCTAKRSELNELQMQYNSYTCVRNTLQDWEAGVNVKPLLLFPCVTHCLFYPDVNIIFHFFWISQ